MNDAQWRFARLAVCLIVLNVAGLLWIRQAVLSRHDRAAQADAGTVRVAATLPASGQSADSAEKLSIVFNQDVGQPDELNQKLQATSAPFLISPEVTGHWNWSSGNQIDFVLDQPLPKGRRFEVTTADGVEVLLGKTVHVSAEIEFRTSPLLLEECRLVTSDRHDVTFELKFNQAVVPAELLKALHVRDSAQSFDTEPLKVGQKDPRLVAVTSLIDKPDQSLVLRCRRPESGKLQVRIAASLTGHEGEHGLDAAEHRSIEVSPFFAFLRSEIDESQHDGFWDVDLSFTTGLAGDQSLPAIEVSPRPEQLRSSLAATWRSSGRLLRLNGKFESGRTYRVTLPPTLLSETQKPLGEEATVQFRIPDREPVVTFPNGNGILSTDGNLELELRTVNVGGLEVSASRVHANNLVAHLQGDWQTQTSRMLGEKTFRVTGTRNESVAHAVALRELLERPSGLYRLEARATDRSWTRDTTLVTVTDLGLTLKQSDTELLVWVTSLRKAAPVAGVQVRSVSYNNQTLAAASTDEHGIARLPVDPRHPDGRPWVVIAESIAPDADGTTEEAANRNQPQIAWLQIGESQQVLDDVDQSGRPHPEVFDVMLFADRGTYRPGETIRLTGILRDEHGAIPPAFPVNVEVVRPDGRTVTTQTVSADTISHGVLSFEYTTPAETYTGPWQFRVVLPGTDEPLAEQHVYVEEFLPVRLEVTASTPLELVTGDTAPTVDVSSRYLFGTPGVGLPVRGHAVYSQMRFQSEEYPRFSFGPRMLAQRHDSGDVETVLDADGHAALPLPVPPNSQRGLWRGDVSVTVTDDGGRSVSTRTRVMSDTLERHIGVLARGRGQSDEDQPRSAIIPVGEEFNIGIVLRDAADRHVPGETVAIELLRIRRDTVLQRNGDDYRWETIEQASTVWQQEVVFEAEEAMVAPDTIEHAGTYRLVATHAVSGSVTEFEFIASADGSAMLADAGNRPGRLDVSLDRELCRPGESIAATISSPFGGSLLVCLESDRVLSSHVVMVEAGRPATVSIDVPVSLRGGAFVSAMLLRSVDPNANEWQPHRAAGLARLMTDHTAQRLPAVITAPEKAEPQSVVNVEVQTEPGSQVLLWAVDEGILLTTSYATPDPHAHFFAPRQLEVITADVFSRLLPDHRRPESMHRIGGDAPEGEDGIDRLRRNPVPTKRRAAAVIWSGLQTADASGRLIFNAALPDFTGELRWMAVVINGDRFGSVDHAMTVTAPLLVEAAWPRFSSPGDRFSVPVKLFNTTVEPMAVQLAWEVNGPIVVSRSAIQRAAGIQSGDAQVEATTPVETEDTGRIDVPAHGSTIVWLDVRATGIGPVEGALLVRRDGVVTSDVASAGSELRQPFSLPVRSALPLTTERQFIVVKAGTRTELTIPDRFAAGQSRTVVTIASESGLDLKPALEHLIDYPYGCVEQTSSQLRALLAAGSILNISGDDVGRRQAVGALIEAGVTRLWSMQTTDGGFSYWPGQRETHLWGSVYAAECLLQAKANGLAVDDRLIEPLTQYLSDRLQKPDGLDIDSNLQAEICCVLSQLGEPPIGWMSVLSERLNELDMAGRAQLAQAWQHAGRRDRALDALPAGTIDLTGEPRYSGRFASTTIGRSRLLTALLQIDPGHAWIPRLATELQQARSNGRWLSTLENALTVDALALRNKMAGGSQPFAGTIRIDAREVVIQPGQIQQVVLGDAAGPFTVTADGSGEVSFEVATTGLPNSSDETSAADVAQGLQVHRRWVNGLGVPINPEAVRVGDLIVVEVTVSSQTNATIDSVAVVDALPTGFEIENPRLHTSDTSYAGEASDAEHAQFLDDRVVGFVTATPHGTTLRYMLRAVTSGESTIPPVQASCMYNEALRSVSGQGRVTVLEIRPRNDGPLKLAEQPDESATK